MGVSGFISVLILKIYLKYVKTILEYKLHKQHILYWINKDNNRKCSINAFAIDTFKLAWGPLVHFFHLEFQS